MTQRTIKDMLAPRDTVSLLPPKAQHAKRARKWERSNRTVSFSIPLRLLERARRIQSSLNRIADKEFALVDEISRVFVRHEIVCYERGEIKLEARPTPTTRKLSLVLEEHSDGWPLTLPDIPKKEKSKRVKFSLSFRWRDDTHTRLTEIAEAHGTHVAEVAVLFLETAIRKYLSGRLVLKKSQHTVENKINGWFDG